MTDIDPGDIVALWAEARSLFFAQSFPPYASPAWRALHPDDPRRLAAALDFAEKWRKYGDEEQLIAWFRDTASRQFNAEGKTAAELAELRKPKPPHQLQATHGWPPIRVPGTRTWRHHINGQQADLPHNRLRPNDYTTERRAA